MKKVFTFLMVALVAFALTGCKSKVWNEIDGIKERLTALEDAVQKTNSDIIALRNIVNALQNNVYVTNVETTADGYTIHFSDGTSAVITNGQDGTNAPIISIRQDADGNYYWTIDGEWLLVDGVKVKANGQDGANGADAVTPQVRINEDTKEWEISTDGGLTWIPTGVIAEGKDGQNGIDGTNGTNGTTPQISIAKDVDGNYYWTLDGEWIIIDGNKVRANGFDGSNGANGLAPQIRINLDTYEWEVSTDGGLTWTSTGVVAHGNDGDSFFQNIDISNPDYVIVTMADGSVFLLARYDSSAPSFVIVDAPEVAQIEYGTTAVFTVETENVMEYYIIAPEGWHAVYGDNTLSVTAPAKDLCHFDNEGTIVITVISETSKMAIVKLNVMVYEDISINGHEYVDLGLPSGLKWATCNVGANSPEEFGNHYAWGEIAPKDNYSESNSETYKVSCENLSAQGYIDENNNLASAHDAATANWGGSWRMPTVAEQRELINNCTFEWTTVNGVDGCKFTSNNNGNSIFFPATGTRIGTSHNSVAEYCNYWSSTPDCEYVEYSHYLHMNVYGGYYTTLDTRDIGFCVRAVSE